MTSLPPLVTRGVGHRRFKYRRSRNGCLTCKRRKVRCNEQRPQCFRCQRLSLECVWKDTIQQQSPSKDIRSGTSPASNDTALQVDGPSPSAALFDFAQSVMNPPEDFSLFQDIYLPDCSHFGTVPARALSTNLGLSSPHVPPQSPPQSPIGDVDVEDSIPLHVPPILEPIESGPKGASVRALFDSLAASSPMVRYSIAAFAAIQYYTAKGKADYQQYYDKAAGELSERFHKSGRGAAVNSNELRYVLTTIFFLTYINLLTGRLDLAYLNLAKAHNALQASESRSLDSTEQRIISWIRLLDARAASAGGEGCLVNDTSGIYPSTPTSTSPSSISGSEGSTPIYSSHEVIYDMLCQPGIAFFQEVQTITGRITRIAHYHRSRGSVEDETEVMAIAANILRDLSSLYDRRPSLMDHAVSGDISSDTLAEPLASAIVRSFQTYLANFYACYINLHRVAHRCLARSKAVITAIKQIKEIMHFMVRSNESIPVNMLWPLFLWGSEEDDEVECQWILETIRGLQHAVTNANMAADVLQEVQRRQREAGARVDIRSVCLELFNVTFAIV
ncbi:C6 finger domain protein [Aspergillus sclerotialis]|uniref:C6 finger domain protein n=1 Tax=Aspergillus sclerotialis TaxID=2070753 RepID=A0A3A2ZQ13_9EURO|nr:C6 finger domain protein [Aspergillus sclerotialis]